MKHLPTGKNKKRFIKYLGGPSSMMIIGDSDCAIGVSWEIFQSLDPRMQTGVLLAYYDSIGIHIQSIITGSGDWLFKIEIENNSILVALGVPRILEGTFNTRPEAQTQAFIKTNQISNEQLEK